MKIKIDRNRLLAALCTSAKADRRADLNHILVEATKNETRLTSTTGSVMSIQRTVHSEKESNECDFARVFIPVSICKGIKKDSINSPLLLVDDGTNWHLVDYLKGVSWAFKDVVHKRRPFEQMIPKKTDANGRHGFDPLLLFKFQKAAQILRKKSARISFEFNGYDAYAVFVLNDPDYVGVLMSLRFSGGEVEFCPSDHWARTALTLTECEK
jgi:hypothetical protein